MCWLYLALLPDFRVNFIVLQEFMHHLLCAVRVSICIPKQLECRTELYNKPFGLLLVSGALGM